MRVPARRNPARQRVARTSSVPAPIKGWNARDSVADMARDDAVILTNWFPSAAEVMHRKGSAEHATDIGSPTLVETLMVYHPPSGNQEFYAAAGDSIYDVGAAGAVGAAEVGSLSNARWQWVNATTSGGSFLIAVNGEDSLLLYDGATWTPIDDMSSPSITNVDTTDLIGVHLHMERVWYIEKDSMNVWYTAAGEITGALTQIPLGGVFKNGGYLLAMGTWTLDGGRGTTNQAVFVSSEGEVAVYQGIDPASATTWALVGVYTIAKPIGRRCLQKLAGDLLIITTDGVVSCSQYLTTDRSTKSVALTDRISSAVADVVALYRDQPGWELTFYPDGSMLLLNVPITTQSEQYVMNTITRAWCRFTGWPAECFAVFEDELYFGTLGEVRKAWVGASDLGNDITSEVVQAFNYYGNRNQQKHFRMVRPILGWDLNPIRIYLGMDVDYKIEIPAGSFLIPSNGIALIWDEGLWDVNTWGGDIEVKKDWHTVFGVGFAGALHMKLSTSVASIRYYSLDVLWEAGDGIT